ncbi:uncharacterized protein LOC124886627 [Capsicum annuum]|uniref:uncharacterized protein LOC124886627 n=1 Tax=Capsicum annuum TaxID=4072 RepID=UPI001FB159A0|nr:uncharacterized protein LOC124886627 [Capsicum annuum]
MEITMRSNKELQGDPPKVTKEIDADLTPSQVNDKVAKNSIKLGYLKEKSTEEVKNMLPLPFPQRQIKVREDAMFKKFFDTFKEFYINLDLLDVLQGMPKYVKYLGDVVTNKVKLQDVETVAIDIECSTVMIQKMPKKLKDPQKFTLPIQIGKNEVQCKCNAEVFGIWIVSHEAADWAGMKTTKLLRGALERKYKTEDVGTKKLFIARFLEIKMIDSESIVSQVQEL